MDAPTTASLLEGIAQSLERRREAITLIKRTVRHTSDTIFFQTCASMAIPLIYAHWEGFVREVFQRYIDYVEQCGHRYAELHPHLLAYSWSNEFKNLRSNSSAEHQAQLANRVIEASKARVAFRKTEKDIDMKSNLNFEVFSEICMRLCLDCTSLIDRKRALNGLVNARNQIAHGGRHENVRIEEIDAAAELAIELMTQVEAMIRCAAVSKAFLAERPIDTHSVAIA